MEWNEEEDKRRKSEGVVKKGGTEKGAKGERGDWKGMKKG